MCASHQGLPRDRHRAVSIHCVVNWWWTGRDVEGRGESQVNHLAHCAMFLIVTKSGSQCPCFAVFTRLWFNTCTLWRCRGSRGIAPPILTLGTRWNWVISFTLRSLYPLSVGSQLDVGSASGSSRTFRIRKIYCLCPVSNLMSLSP